MTTMQLTITCAIVIDETVGVAIVTLNPRMHSARIAVVIATKFEHA
jgi:phosphatidylglycerophosphatase A